VLQRLAKQGAGNVYATDTILAVLMTADKSVHSWDIVIRKEGDNLYLDKRPNSKIDFQSVNESWSNEALLQLDKESINHPKNLSVEATFINYNFQQQLCLKDKSQKQSEANPFLDSLNQGSEPASVAYRYRKIALTEKITLVCRTEVNSVAEDKDRKEPLALTVKALNEFDSKLTNSVDWRQKLETQTGAILATEVRNNVCKLARWTSEALLAGTDELKLGFVARVNPKDAFKHHILMVKRYRPLDFAASVNAKPKHLWGVLRFIIELCQGLDDGKYLLMRDAYEPTLHLYHVPANAFQNETGVNPSLILAQSKDKAAA